MEGKNERQVNDKKEDIPTRHEAEFVMFKSELPTQPIRFPNFPPPFLAGTPIIFNHMLEMDSICLHCKFILRMNPT